MEQEFGVRDGEGALSISGSIGVVFAADRDMYEMKTPRDPADAIA
ncbi:MAG: hypothetical protein ABIP17_13280 [Ilumatobacteraceae bacterium]